MMCIVFKKIINLSNTTVPVGTLLGIDFFLRTALLGRRCVLFQKPFKIQRFKGCCLYFQNHPSPVTYDLGETVNNLADQCKNIAKRINQLRSEILVERLIKKSGNQHRLMYGIIGRKSIEWKDFQKKIVENQCPNEPLHDRMRLKARAVLRLSQRLIDYLCHCQLVGQQWAPHVKSQKYLVNLIQRSEREDGAKALSVVALGVQFQILLTHLTAVFVARIGGLVKLTLKHNKLLYRLIQLAFPVFSDAQLFQNLKGLLNEKSHIDSNNDCSPWPIMLLDCTDYRKQYLIDRFKFDDLGISTAKERIYDLALPGNLIRMKPLQILVKEY